MLQPNTRMFRLSLQSSLDAFQVYTPEQVQEFSQKMVTNVPVDQLHSILDAAAEVFRTSLPEEQQDDFRERLIIQHLDQ